MSERPEITAEAILATAKKLNIELTVRYWMDGQALCGCAAGTACLLLYPDLCGSDISAGEVVHILGEKVARGLDIGFCRPAQFDAEDLEVAHFQAVGRQVRAALIAAHEAAGMRAIRPDAEGATP